MKILYVITTLEHGRGGHYYSCGTIAASYHKLNALSDTIDICDIGINKSPIIESLQLKKFFLNVAKNGFLKSLIIFVNIVKNSNYDILHAYDRISFAFVSIASMLLKKNNILTLCGGPNIPNYPYSSNMILFSEENFDFYKNNHKYKQTNLFLLPNRVTHQLNNSIDVTDEKEKLGLKGFKVLLRIARISETYIEQFLNIIKKFRELYKELPCLRMLIIGVIESKKAYDRLVKSIKETNDKFQQVVVTITTNDNYTINASRYIDLADFVIATGRGAMEAMAKSKPVFIPIDNNKLVLITEETVPELSYHNYSGRISKIINPYFEKYYIENIISNQINRDDYIKKVKKFSFNWYERNLSIVNVIKDYEKIYQSVKNSKLKIKPLDCFINLARSFKYIKKYAQQTLI